MTKETSMTQAIKACRKLIQEQKYGEAGQRLQKLLEEDPKDEDALELLGMTSFFQQNLETAHDCFDRLTQLNPSHTKAWVNLGAILNRMGEYRKATEVLRRALQKDRKCAEAYYNMGIAQRGMQANTMAISAYKEAIKLAPEMTDAHINLGNIYTDMKNTGLALQCFQAALRHNPQSAKARKCFETVQSMQKTTRKQASPFGRLVDVADLSKQQDMTNHRDLPQASRLAERELIQKHTKIVRASAREFIAQLDKTLPQRLHRLKIAFLHVEERLDATDLLKQLNISMEELRLQHANLKTASHIMQECMKSS